MANSRLDKYRRKHGIHRALTSSRPPPVLRLCCMKASRSISPPRLLRFLPIGILRCAIFTRLRRSSNYLRRITASFLACDLNAEMGRKTRNLDAITNGQWYLLKAISLPIMQGGLILYNSIPDYFILKKTDCLNRKNRCQCRFDWRMLLCSQQSYGRR